MARLKRPSAPELRQRRHALHAAVEQGGLPFADTIRQMRAAMGMTQARFGQVFKLTARQVLELEHGTANPTAETLNRLGRPYGFEVGFVKRRAADAEG